MIFESNDGFEIARAGPCDRAAPASSWARGRSGVPMLRFADLERDADLIEAARDTAEELLASDPRAAAAHVQRWLGGKAEFFKA